MQKSLRHGFMLKTKENRGALKKFKILSLIIGITRTKFLTPAYNILVDI